jgi:hypothetical protein
VIPAGQEVSQAALRSLAAVGQDLADAEDLDGALGVLAEAAASGVGATLAVIRVAERGGAGRRCAPSSKARAWRTGKSVSKS